MDQQTTRRSYVGREPFDLDPRFTNLDKISEGSYGFVVSADDSTTFYKILIFSLIIFLLFLKQG